MLDAALAELEEADCDALVLRFFKNQDLRSVGLALGVTDDTAQKRVARALNKLRERLEHHSILTTVAALSVAISANAVKSAPAGLTATICAATLAGTAVQTSTAIAATKTVAMTALQKAIIGTALVAVVGTGVFEARQNSHLCHQVQTFQRQQAPRAEEIRRLRREYESLTNRLARLMAENAQLQSNQNQSELLRLRAKVTQLQADSQTQNDPVNLAAKSWLDRVNQLKQWTQQNPTAAIPGFQYLTKQDWLNAAQKPLDTDVDYRRAMSSLRCAADGEFASMLQEALSKYVQASASKWPTNLSALQPYYASPVGDAMLQRWEIVLAKTVSNIGIGSPTIVTERSAVDELLDTRWVVGPRGKGGTGFLGSPIGNILKPVYQAFRQAHGENSAEFTLSNLLGFAKTPAQRAAVQKLIEQNRLRAAP